MLRPVLSAQLGAPVRLRIPRLARRDDENAELRLVAVTTAVRLVVPRVPAKPVEGGCLGPAVLARCVDEGSRAFCDRFTPQLAELMRQLTETAFEKTRGVSRATEHGRL